MAKRKQLYYRKILVNGEFVDNKCPECEGDGVDFLDYTHARGGEMIPQLCGMCEGNGLVDKNVMDIQYDNDGNRHIIYKEDRDNVRDNR